MALEPASCGPYHRAMGAIESCSVFRLLASRHGTACEPSLAAGVLGIHHESALGMITPANHELDTLITQEGLAWRVYRVT